MKKKIKVPSLPVLARRMEASMRDYQVVYEKEFADWCACYVDYFVAIGKAKPGDPYGMWHARACRMARELIESERQ